MPIFSYIRHYFKTVHTGLLIFAIIYTALLVFCNYRFGIEQRIIQTAPTRFARFAAFYGVYFLAFAVPYGAIWLKEKQIDQWKPLLLLVVLCPAVFALKVTFNGFAAGIEEAIGGVWGRYWAIIARLPLKCMLVTLLLAIMWWAGKYDQPFPGTGAQQASWKPYIVMLLLMVPLVGWASFQPAFLHTYPKLQLVSFIEPYTTKAWLYKLLFELSYGMDFITIELFFRGFLILAFIRYVGHDAILPMAVFYCSIHFGKPMAECMSSFFGGLLLGIIVYNTKSITGGLAVHLGIAWMMEAGGLIGHAVRKAVIF